jgi:predicted RNA-binding Zn ribbon-like protein
VNVIAPVDLDHLPQLGGAPCLDFVNTVDPRFGPGRIEYLTSYEALVRWAGRTGALAAADQQALLDAAEADPRGSRAVLRRALALREALYHLLTPRMRSSGVQEHLDILNGEIQNAGRRAAVRPTERGYVLDWVGRRELDQVLRPVMRSATELMTSADLARVRECDGRNCGWLFLDTSKAGRRRWCSMAICGNRAKSERFRRRVAATVPQRRLSGTDH